MKRQAKMRMLQEMKGQTKKADMEGSGLADGIKNKSMQKVTVAAPTKSGLKKGLSIAQELMSKRHGTLPEMEDSREEESEDDDTMEDTMESLASTIKDLEKEELKKRLK